MKILYSWRWFIPTLLCVAFALSGAKAQQSDYPPDQLLIKFSESAKPGFGKEMKAKLKVAKAQKFRSIGTERWDLSFPMTFDGRRWDNLDQLLPYLNQLSEVKYAEPNYPMKTRMMMPATPDDPLLGQQWALNNTGQNIGGGGSGTPDADIDALEAWDVRSTSPDVIIGFLDTGIDWTHRDLVDNIWQNLAEDADGDGKVLEWDGTAWIFDPGDENNIDDDGNGYVDDFIGWDFANNDNNPMDDDTLQYGTHAAGIIGATGNNNTGIVGVTWDVQMMPLKIFNDNPTGLISDAILALEYSTAMGADFTNNAWAVTDYAYSLPLFEAISELQNAGKPFLTIVFGDGVDIDQTPQYPAAYQLDNIIVSTGTDFNDELITDANFGATNVDLAAPGEYIATTHPGNSYKYYNSVGYSSSFVSGALALMIAEYPTLDYLALKNKLLSSVDVLPNLTGKCATSGRLNLFKSLLFGIQILTTDATCSDDGTAEILNPDNSQTYAYYWSNGETGNSISALAAGNYDVTVVDAQNTTTVLDFTIGGTNALAVAVNISGNDATAQTSGGSGVYTYQWSTGQNTMSVTGLPGGNHQLTVSDDEGCSNISSLFIPYSISGVIGTCNGTPLNQVDVGLTGNSTLSSTTATSGIFDFVGLNSGDYTITPMKTNRPASDGLTGLDVLLIQRHIIGTSPLTDPCDLIAADVNESCGITGLDILYIRRVILGTMTDFPSGKTWRFVPADHVFPTGVFPCNFPETTSYTSLNQDEMNQNFKGIKLGDVNSSVNPSL